MESINMKPTGTVEGTDKIENTTPAPGTETASTTVEPSANQTKPEGTAPESPSDGGAALTGKHSVTYIAGGLWTDSTGQTWSRDAKGRSINHKVFTAEELAAREDIKYMIKYGAMKDIQV